MTIAALAMAGPIPLAAQQVHVYENQPPAIGATPLHPVTNHEANQRLLVIPVVSQDSPFDMNNNLLDPAVLAHLQDALQQTNAFWSENSYARVSFQATVLDRYYQMPRGTDHYFNPAYAIPQLIGTALGAEPIAVPAGSIRLVLHISDADETVITVDFPGGAPLTYAGLETAIRAELGVGDKLQVRVAIVGAVRRLEFTVGQTYVRAGTFVHLDYAASNPAVLDALGLDRPNEELNIPRVTSRGADFPLTTQAGWTFTITIANDAGASEAFTWTPPAATYPAPADFVASQAAAVAGVTITVAGGELQFAIAPTIPLPITTATFSGTPALLDGLGLAESSEIDGVIHFSARNTVRGDRRLIVGQAIAAYMLNELTRPHVAPPAADPIPNTAITAANEGALDALMAANVDVYRAFVVVFIDAPNKRAGATGGHFNVGIDNGGFLYEYQTYASGQIAFDFSNAQTIAHETGHNIGFADLYNNSDGSYHPGLLFPRNWDVMDTQNQFPHTGLWHKEITAGWLTAAGAGVGRLDAPAALGAVTTANFVLTPLEFGSAEYDALLAGAPPGRAVVKAIRLGLSAAADDHYMLLSNRRHGTAFSQTLPQRAGAATRGGIYVTDAISTRSFDFFRPSTRNFEHPLSDPAPIAGDANPVVDNNPSPDLNLLATYPAYDGISVDIVGEIPGPGALNDRPSYLVDIRREQKDFLDLRITPWGAPPYESPDIWIEQAQNALSAAPLPGNGEPARWSADYDQAANGGIPLNFIRVKVTNSGTVPATAVQVRVKVNTPGGMGDDGTWVSLPLSDAKDVPAGGSAIFDLPWNPRVNRHTCILAEVYRWTSDLGDLEPWNNATQENVNSFHPTAASPWETMPVEFEVANGFATPIEVAIEPENLPPGYILALNESFLSIPGRSKTLVTGTLRMDENIIPPMTAAQARKQRPATFHVAAYVMGGDYRIFAGGITYQVFPSVRTEVSVQVGMTTAGEIAVTGSTSPPADNTRVTVVLRYPSGRYQWVDATTDANGGISVTIPPLEQGNVRVLVEVPPGDGFAPVTTGPFMVATSEPPGARQGVAGSDYTGFYLGGLFMEDTLQLRSGLHTGFRYGRFFRQRFSAEIETGIMPTSRAGVSGLFGNAQANIRFHPLPPSTPARVFALIGAGVGWFRGVGASDASLVYTVGVGADFRWTPSVGFRLDARDYMPADLFTSGVTHNLQINWATIFHF